MAIKKHKITVTLDWASLNKDVQDKAYRMARLLATRTCRC